MCAALVAFVFAAAHAPRSAQSPPSVPTAQSVAGLHVSGTNIVEGNGNSFVMRGVSYPYAWHKNQNQSLADIKKLGTNTVRVVLDSSIGAGEVSDVISTCKQNRLICVLENHDTTGYGDSGSAITLDQAADYWVGLKNVLAGQESYVVINIGNEPYGNNSASAWTDATSGAIKKLRDAGLKHLIMVDGPGWGQDWSGVMRNTASSVFASDPQRNTVFSVHMYGVYGTASKITDYYDAFQSAGLPLVVGEFGWKHTDGDVDEDAIINEARSRGIGYLGWSWSGNSGGVEYLDMATNFNPDQLTSWGQRLFNGANGIRATSKEATVFGGRVAVE
ncbi:glycoside hydrolase family 5 protein [Planosporangium mesophilum]|uniref:glycoside hydrolase family 5 protein n=1 Tax=Planosporangium mesophilum TaxID=689768 RepID=UPI0027E42E86|nr:glycoside hydrolase family 5 protein [Planosporangium mesophilum]